MEFELTILGSSSASPTKYRNPTAQLLNFRNTHFLIDCGEGTQKQLKINGFNHFNITKIFISHLHGDHYLGLFGLLSSMSLNGREKPLDLYAPAELQELLALQSKISKVYWSFELRFHPTQNKTSELIFEDHRIEIFSIPLKHRVPTTGFVFKEKPLLRKLNPKMLRDYDIPNYVRASIKKGADFTTEDGHLLTNKQLTLDPEASRSYAYCSDTKYTESILEDIKGVDLLYHEATFLDQLADRAKTTGHSTAKQAGEIAKLAAVKQLVIGHFSSRYRDLNPLLDEAKTEFPNTVLAIENTTISL
ncbi:MAG: ribonuclease Z [Flavobacteriales bacterium]